MNSLDILSWSATFFIMISFFFEGEKLRYLNGFGAILWSIWGIYISESAVIFLNGMIILIHLWKLSKAKREKIKNRLEKFFKDRHIL